MFRIGFQHMVAAAAANDIHRLWSSPLPCGVQPIWYCLVFMDCHPVSILITDPSCCWPMPYRCVSRQRAASNSHTQKLDAQLGSIDEFPEVEEHTCAAQTNTIERGARPPTSECRRHSYQGQGRQFARPCDGAARSVIAQGHDPRGCASRGGGAVAAAVAIFHRTRSSLPRQCAQYNPDVRAPPDGHPSDSKREPHSGDHVGHHKLDASGPVPGLSRPLQGSCGSCPSHIRPSCCTCCPGQKTDRDGCDRVDSRFTIKSSCVPCSPCAHSRQLRSPDRGSDYAPS